MSLAVSQNMHLAVNATSQVQWHRRTLSSGYQVFSSTSILPQWYALMVDNENLVIRLFDVCSMWRLWAVDISPQPRVNLPGLCYLPWLYDSQTLGFLSGHGKMV